MYSGPRAKLSSGETKALGERIVAFLRKRHPSKTAANVSAEAGLPTSTVAKWLEGAATPGLYAGLRLFDVYGPDLVAAAWPRQAGFLSTAARDAQREQIDAEIAALQAQRAKL